jgi:NADP-dependent 3-hydroxy acid dehydrogenase YdfG
MAAEDLRGRVVAVTGASRGIGRAIALQLAAAGATVLAGARRHNAEAVPGVQLHQLDVADESSVRQFADAAISAGVDVLVNNAGIGTFGPIEEASVEDYRRIFDTNVLGTLLLCKAMIPAFRGRHDRGLSSQVINITSDVSDRTFPGGALYTASKYAQRALTQTLAHEGAAYGLRVTEVRPGMVDTFFGGRQPGAPERSAHLQAEDVASAVAYALAAPPHVRIDEIVLHPVVQEVVF